MTSSTQLACHCGQVRMELAGSPIAVVDCLCDSCRAVGRALATLPNAQPVLDAKSATPFVMQRKDRLTITAGQDHLAQFRLTPDAHTRRVVATCCNTPVFLEFEKGHWLSVYANLWPETQRPTPEWRTMTGDLDAPDLLPNDVPNLKSHNLAFFARLLGAWIKMGFRTPKVAINRTLDIQRS